MQPPDQDDQGSDADTDVDADTDAEVDADTDAEVDADTDADEQSTGQQEAYEWWWDERLSVFLDTADSIVETCLDQVFDDSTLRDSVHVDVLADIDDIETYHEKLSARRIIADDDGTYDLDWEVETTDGMATEVFLNCHAEYVDDSRDVTTEIDVALVASAAATDTELVSQPHVIHRPISA
jgi:hypothetical protein